MDNQIKIRNAKAFADMHKNSILPIGIDSGNATDEDWLSLFGYIWENLHSDGHEPPYIELRSHETESGHPEIFELDSVALEAKWFKEFKDNCE